MCPKMEEKEKKVPTAKNFIYIIYIPIPEKSENLLQTSSSSELLLQLFVAGGSDRVACSVVLR